MLARIATGVIGGVLLLVLLLSGLFPALATIALLHAIAIYEYTRLEPQLPRGAVALYVLLGTVVLTLSSLALAKVYAGELVPALLVLFMALILAGDLWLYQRTGHAGAFGYLARGVMLITLPFSFIPAIAMWPGGFPYLLLLIGGSFGTDVGGMLCGKLIGGPKLAARLSPGKTWAGFVGGLLAGAACWMVTVALWPPHFVVGGTPFNELPSGLQLILAACGGLLCGLIGITGDLTFSLIKRQHGVKDYGTLLPGHGGVLDRFDAFIFCAALVYLICLL